MRYRPPGLTDQQVRDALGGDWTVEYAPVGAGSYHWIATDGTSTRFVSVDDLDDKPWLGQTREQALAGLTACLRTAAYLRDQSGLDFIAAPLGPLRRLTGRYTIAVFPYLDGTTGSWGDQYEPADQRRLSDMLTAIHGSSVLTTVPVSPVELPGRHAFETALSALGRPWPGQEAEAARALLTEHQAQLRHHLHRYDTLAAYVQTLPKVLTHGEPHPGNVLRTNDGHLLLLDWDTLGLAPAERDLWLIGAPGDPAALGFYRLRWPLLDVVMYTAALLRGDAPARQLEDLRKPLTELAERAAQEL